MMKRILNRLVTLAIAFLISSGAIAQVEEQRCSINLIDPLKITLDLDVAEHSALQIRIINTAGDVLHEEVVTRAGTFFRKYDLSELLPGGYAVVLEDLSQQKTIPFRSALDRIEIFCNDLTIELKPVVVN